MDEKKKDTTKPAESGKEENGKNSLRISLWRSFFQFDASGPWLYRWGGGILLIVSVLIYLVTIGAIIFQWVSK